MNKQPSRFLLLTFIFSWFVLLIPINRYFFKGNDSFSIRFIYSAMPPQIEWDVPALTTQQSTQLDEILAQDFFYLAKGTHCYAFMSKDKKYVIKFHRYPSHMRVFSWDHPLAYHINKKRIGIKKHNFERFAYFMNNYKASYEDLKEETGLILMHLNCTNSLKKDIALIDKTGNRYKVPLDQVTFILQYKADFIYPILDQYLSHQEEEKAKKVISNILQLIVQTCQKGFVNNDPVLYRNYGLFADRAIYIDVGDLITKEGIDLPENYLPHVMEITSPLRSWIIQHYPTFLSYYEAEIAAIQIPQGALTKKT